MSRNPIKPFWSWNDKLCKQELESQIEAMKKVGIDGFFMHARGGLITEYMSDEWFDMIGACLDKADTLGMDAWAYDENGWPSGFANGKVPAKGEAYRQKWLCLDIVKDVNSLPENVLGYYILSGNRVEMLEKAKQDCYVIYYSSNVYYIDTFNPDAIDCFIENTHEKYFERFGNRFGSSLKGFFTDEPQYLNNGHAPWSVVFEKSFKERYGYDLIPQLLKLFVDTDDSAALRSDFYNMVSDDFRETFIKKMYDWCTEHNCRLTGHMMNEDSILVQMRSTGGVMSCYKYFHEPGIDWLGRFISTPLVPKQLGSAAYQLGRKTLTESFALCGWDVSLNELKWIAQWQAVNGVTMLCPHLEGYSLRGERKRDYPASLFRQLPWFEEGYPAFAEYWVKLGELLDSGKDTAPLLVIHPIQSAYILYNPEDTAETERMDDGFAQITSGLSGEHILHHYGDEVLIAELSEVKNGVLKVGNCEYTAVLLPSLIGIKDTTLNILIDFVSQGGSLYIYGSEPQYVNGRHNLQLDSLLTKAEKVKDFSELKEKIDFEFAHINTFGRENQNIHYCQKKMPDGSILYYLVNLSDEPQEVTFEVDGSRMLSYVDAVSGTEEKIGCEYGHGITKAKLNFAEYGSLLISAEDGGYTAETEVKSNTVKLDKAFDVTECSENAITLDSCEYRINGGEWQSEKAVIRIQSELLALQKACDISLRFHFYVEKGAKVGNAALCIENPEKMEFIINGRQMKFADMGYFIDKSIRRTDISELVVEGENEIIINCNFYQRQKVYDVLFLPNVHEVEINKLTYDTELESIYIVGDFGTKSNDGFTLGEKKSIFTQKSFSITSPVKKVDINNITVTGYWFFAGKMTLSQNVKVDKKPGEKYTVSLKKLYSPAAELFVNGKKAGDFNFAPYTVDVTEFINNGDNKIEIRLLSGNRNLLGPHHRIYGESYYVCPLSFTDKQDWGAGWGDFNKDNTWTDNYSFVLFGAEV